MRAFCQRYIVPSFFDSTSLFLQGLAVISCMGAVGSM
jgi:hypothetical protein